MRNKHSRTIWRVMIFCLFFITACGGGGDTTHTVIAEPGISVTGTSPTVFNGVVVKNSAERQFTITSTGTRTLNIGSISVSSTNSEFSIPAGYNNCSGRALAVGATCTFIVRYEPTDQREEEAGTISIPGDVPATVALTGYSYGLNVWINQIVSADCTPGSEQVVFDVTLTNPNSPGTIFDQDNFESLLSGGEGGLITQGGVAQTITGFLSLDPDTVSAVVALDLSSSLTSAIGNIRTAAAYLINNKMADDDEVAMVKFKSDIKIYPDPLVKNFTIISTPAGRDEFTDLTTGFIFNTATDPTSEGTAFFNAVYDAITRAKLGNKSTRAVIVLSDGANNITTGKTLEQVIAYANAVPKVPVFTIYYVDPAAAASAKPAIMDDLAERTGGQDFYAESTSINNIFDQIWTALTKKYRITYVPISCATGSFDLRVGAGSGTLRGFDTETITFPTP